MTKIIIFLIILFIYHIQPQNILKIDLNSGSYLNNYKQNRNVSRHYLCGMSVAKKQEYYQPQQNCSKTHCISKFFFYCRRYAYNCTVPPRKLIWSRINGIKVVYCNYKNWNQQIALSKTSDWQWSQMKMCPQNHYINGFSLKTDQRDGITAIKIKCKSMITLKQQQHIIVDSKGQWINQYSKDKYAISFSPKIYLGYITGLSMQVVEPVYINNVNIEYQFPKSFKVNYDNIHSQIILNFDKNAMIKTMKLNNYRQYGRLLSNQYDFWQGTTILQNLIKIGSQHLPQTIDLQKIISLMKSKQSKINNLLVNKIQNTLKPLLKIPFLSYLSNQIQNKFTLISQKDDRLNEYKFGENSIYKVSIHIQRQINIKPCNQVYIKVLLPYSSMAIPYLITIQYSNGLNKQNDVVKGMFSGTVIGQSITTIDMKTICQTT